MVFATLHVLIFVIFCIFSFSATDMSHNFRLTVSWQHIVLETALVLSSQISTLKRTTFETVLHFFIIIIHLRHCILLSSLCRNTALGHLKRYRNSAKSFSVVAFLNSADVVSHKVKNEMKMEPE